MYAKLYFLPLLLLTGLLFFLLEGFQQAPATAQTNSPLSAVYEYLDYGEVDSARQLVKQLQRTYQQEGSTQEAKALEVVLAEIAVSESENLEQALSILEAIRPLAVSLPDSTQAQWRGLFVLAHAQFGDWETAERLYQELPEAFPDWKLELLFQLLYQATGQEIPHALDFYSEAASRQLEQYPKLKADTLRWADVLAYQAAAKDYRGQPDTALAIYRQILPLLEQRSDVMAKESLYVLYNDMATVYHTLEDIGKSIEYYQKALLVMEELPKTQGYYENSLVVLGNMAYNQYVLQRYTAALETNHRALAVAREAEGDLEEDYLSIVENLVLLHLRLKNVDSTKHYLQLFKAKRKEESTQLLRLKAEVALLDRDYEQALKDYQVVRRLMRAQGFSERTINRRSLWSLIDIYLGLERPKDALVLINNDLHAQHPGQYPSFDSLVYPSAYLEVLEQRLVIAQSYPELIAGATFLKDARYAIQLMERVQRSFSGALSKQSILQQLSSIYSYAVEAALREGAIEEAFTMTEKAKSALLSEHLQERDAVQQNTIDPAVAEKERDLQRDLAYYRHQRFVLQDDPKAAKEAQSKYLLLRDEWRKLQERLDTDYPQYYQLKYADIKPDLKAVQAKLQEGQLVLEYLETRDKLFVFALDQKELRHWVVDLPDNYRARVAVFQQALSDPEAHQSKPVENRAQLAQHGQALFDLYVPDSSLLENYEQLIIVPDGQMHYLPFEVLLEHPVLSNKPFQEWPFLVKKWDISYLYTTQLWLQMRKREKAPRLEMLAYAPSYSGEPAQSRAPSTQQLRYQLQDLPGARREVQQLEGLLSGDFYYDAQANEKGFKERAAEYQILHLAMHGVVNNEHPSYSNLVFTETGDAEDNLLHAYELQQMQLSAELVFLSACETGYGQYQKGEGVASLARSFMYAGVPSVVQSLWKVSDYAGAKVVEHYYRELLSNKNKSEALRQAKLDYLGSVSEKEQHPFYWASFVQLGDLEALEVVEEGGEGLVHWAWWLAPLGLALVLLFWRYKRG